MTFGEREFRSALGRFTTGVVIVTAEVDGCMLGNTVSSFNSVSLSPPLVLFSIARSALSFELWRRTERFGASVLSEDQIALSNRFAQGGIDKRLGVMLSHGQHGVPLLPNSVATFECATHAFHDGGDHEIVVGRVLSFRTCNAQPLLFYGGRYRQLRSDIQLAVAPDTDPWLHGW